MGSIESTNDTFRANFSDYEKIYLNMSRAFNHTGKEHWGIHCVCGIAFSEDSNEAARAASLRESWKGLLYEYPGLSVVPNGTSKDFNSIDASVADEWADNTFFAHRSLDADSIVAQSGPRELPALHYLVATSEIVFLSQHWRNDALGTCMLLNRLFELLTERTEASSFAIGMNKAAQPSPSLEDAAFSIDHEDEELQQYARDYIDEFHRKAINSGGLPYEGDASTAPRESSHKDMTFGVESTKAIVKACKIYGISVSAAIHTALAKTVFSFSAPEERDNGYTTVMAVNMRDHLPSPYNTKAHACQTYVASITPTVPYRADSFTRAAAMLTLEYKDWYTDRFRRALRWIYRYHAAKLFASRPADGTASPKPPSGVTLSSLGVIENHLKGQYGHALMVKKFRFGVSMATRQTLLYAWTFKGRLCLSLDYNTAYYTDAMVDGVLLRVKTALEEGLAVGLTSASGVDGNFNRRKRSDSMLSDRRPQIASWVA